MGLVVVMLLSVWVMRRGVRLVSRRSAVRCSVLSTGMCFRR
jgi:hypothetical protein